MKKEIKECKKCGRTSEIVDMNNCPFCQPKEIKEKIDKILKKSKLVVLSKAEQIIRWINIDDIANKILELFKGREKEIELETRKDRYTAKQCLNFKGFHCDNKDCLNGSCPLNKRL